MAPPRNSAGLSEVRASPRGKSPAANSDGEMGDPAELKSRAFICLVKQRGSRGFPAARWVVSDDSAHGARLLSAPNQRGPRPFSPAAFRPFGCLGSQPGALSSPWCPSPQPEASTGKAVKVRPTEEAGRTSHPPSEHRMRRLHGRTPPGALHAVRLIPSKSPWRRRAGSSRCSPPANRSRRPRPFRRTAFPAAPPGYIASPRGTTPPCRR